MSATSWACSGEPNQVHYTANMERGIDTSGILTMDYSGFRAVSMAAKDCAAPARYIIQGTKGYIPAEIHRQLVRRRHLPPERGAGRSTTTSTAAGPGRRQSFHAFARAIASGDQELCSRMLDTSVAVSKVLTVARAVGRTEILTSTLEYALTKAFPNVRIKRKTSRTERAGLRRIRR